MKKLLCMVVLLIFLIPVPTSAETLDEAYESGLIYRVLTTNLIYQTEELLSRPYYLNVDMSKYIALLIDALNHDASISEYLNPANRIQRIVEKYKK